MTAADQSVPHACANQFRLLIHTAAYWLLHSLRGLAPKSSFWRDAQFDTLRLALIKAAARVTELVTRIKVALPSAYPHQTSFALLAARAPPAARPEPKGRLCPEPSPSLQPQAPATAPPAPPPSAPIAQFQDRISMLVNEPG